VRRGTHLTPMPNRLALATSPYLRQHAGNPVDWYPWGSEALARARELDRPIFLSIGYSACHWCHVMERESFEDPEIAALLAESFVSIKVDREERPDLDAVYMRAVQTFAGRGGWPLTAFLTPTGAPFYGGTYFPPQPRHGLPSFRQLLEAIASAWQERREEVVLAGEELRDLLERSTLGPRGELEAEPAPFPPSLIQEVTRRLLAAIDPVHGGIGGAPKFPQPVLLHFLLSRAAAGIAGPAAAAGSTEASLREPMAPVLETLRTMARGGIRDHLGGGFHRYAVDSRWLVPHFEKMLYDQALMAQLYLRGFQLTGEEEFRRVCSEVIEDLLRDFRDAQGSFSAAWDADSEGEEGLYYLWTLEEIRRILPAEEATLFALSYDVSVGGNFEGRSILNLPHSIAALAVREGIPEETLRERLSAARETLRTHRTQRIPPLRDDKVLVGWNALVIRALAEAGAALGEPEWIEAAAKAARVLLEGARMEGRLLHLGRPPHVGAPPERAFLGGAPIEDAIPAFLEDVAGLGNALLSLHEATLDRSWLQGALDLDAEVEARFRDPATGLLFDTPEDGETLLIRPRELMDSPAPSGSALAAELSLRLGRLLGDPARVARTDAHLAREAEGVRGMPQGFGHLLSVAVSLQAAPIEILFEGSRQDPRMEELLAAAHRPWLPHRVIGLREGGRVEGAPTAFLCRDFACEAPTDDPKTLAQQLDEIRLTSLPWPPPDRSLS